ncbi:MAG: hypothetical protein JWM68_844 [Verrucomicrobiales bacterium]|nr:hypothetical protein [Verrucomicrobiales bacterium]
MKFNSALTQGKHCCDEQVFSVVKRQLQTIAAERNSAHLGFLIHRHAMATASNRSSTQMTPVLDRNINALLKKRQEEERTKTTTDKVSDAITQFVGSMRFVYLHLAVYGAWIAVNLPWAPDWLRFDPTFVILAMEASVEAIFLSTFILISQNRMQAMSERRNDLDLQISLLSEHEITRLITLVKAIAEKLEVQESHDPELNELEQDVHPERVLERIEEAEEHTAAEK